VGRIIRSKLDYGLMIFADARYARSDKRKKLPGWIQQYLDASSWNMSIDNVISRARDFLRKIAQPTEPSQELGVTMLLPRHIEALQAQERAKRARLYGTLEEATDSKRDEQRGGEMQMQTQTIAFGQTAGGMPTGGAPDARAMLSADADANRMQISDTRTDAVLANENGSAASAMLASANQTMPALESVAPATDDAMHVER
jgi:hypothetical protein